MRPLFLLSLLLVSLLTFANQAVTTPVPVIPNVKFETLHCPAVNQLKRNTNLVWEGPNGWKSYGESFSAEVDHFINAQWIGVNVGKIICIYAGKGKATFPISIEREDLVTNPAGGKWGRDEGGYKNCHSMKASDCPFLIEKPKAVGDIYQEIDFYKNAKPSE